MNKQVQNNQTNLIKQLEMQAIAIQKNVSDSTVTDFFSSIDTLRRGFATDKTVASLLKMMYSIGTYVEKKKDNAHVDSFSVLTNLIKGLNSVLNSELTSSETHQILKENYEYFRQLKQKLSTASPEQNRIYELKTALLSLEWEINHETLALYKQTISDLKQAWRTNRLYSSFLNILNVLGNYIDLQKENAHNRTIAFARMIYDHLEYIVLNPGMPFEKKKKILERDIEKLNAFKKAISQKNRHPDKKRLFKDLQPALYQYKRTTKPFKNLSDEFFPLTDAQAFASEHETGDILESLDISSDIPPRDVMDDLFNPKASPVDELLEKIHLMNVLGKDKTIDKPVQKNNSTTESTGIREIYPVRMENKKPRQEISHRIEAFFDLDPSPQPSEKDDTDAVFPEKPVPDEPFQKLSLLINRAIESMNSEDIEQVIYEMSKQNNLLTHNPENKELNHLLLSCGKLFEQLTDRFVRENKHRPKKLSVMLSKIKRIFNPS